MYFASSFNILPNFNFPLIFCFFGPEPTAPEKNKHDLGHVFQTLL